MFTTIINAEALQQHYQKTDWVILDCRFNLADPQAGQKAYETSHIAGALYLNLDLDLSSPITAHSGRHPLPDLALFAQRLGQLGVSNATQVIVYDDCAGAMAARCWWLLRLLGHRAVAVLDGGFPAWISSGGEADNSIPDTVAVEYAADLQTNMNLAVHEVIAGLENQLICLVDARAAERFRGEVEPIDPVAGHVPGALNRPLTDNIAAGVFKPSEQLHQEWSALLGTRSCDEVVHMCGSGVTACHNYLAMEIAGLLGSRVYAGSWSEWIRDPSRPVA